MDFNDNDLSYEAMKTVLHSHSKFSIGIVEGQHRIGVVNGILNGSILDYEPEWMNRERMFNVQLMFPRETLDVLCDDSIVQCFQSKSMQYTTDLQKAKEVIFEDIFFHVLQRCSDPKFEISWNDHDWWERADSNDGEFVIKYGHKVKRSHSFKP